MTSASCICASDCLSSYSLTLPLTCSEIKLSTSQCVTMVPKLLLIRTFGVYLSIKASTFHPNAFILIILLIYFLSFFQSRPFNLKGSSMKISSRSVLLILPFMVRSYSPTVDRQFTCNFAVSNIGERGLGLLMNILRVEQKKLSMEPPRRITSKNYQKQYKYVAIFLSMAIFQCACYIFSQYASMVIQLLKLVTIFKRVSFVPQLPPSVVSSLIWMTSKATSELVPLQRLLYQSLTFSKKSLKSSTLAVSPFAKVKIFQH